VDSGNNPGHTHETTVWIALGGRDGDSDIAIAGNPATGRPPYSSIYTNLSPGTLTLVSFQIFAGENSSTDGGFSIAKKLATWTDPWIVGAAGNADIAVLDAPGSIDMASPATSSAIITDASSPGIITTGSPAPNTLATGDLFAFFWTGTQDSTRNVQVCCNFRHGNKAP
jgi:hypothetical protein